MKNFFTTTQFILVGFGIYFFYLPINQKNTQLSNFNFGENSTVVISSRKDSTGDLDIINIPLKRAGKLLLIEANVDGRVGNLVFDSGASGIVLNKTYFRDYVKVEKTPSNGITGNVGNVYSITVESIDLGDLCYKNVRADLVELGHIENRRGVKILGLFGLSHLRDYEIIIDVNNGQLTLLKLDKKGNRKSSFDIGFNPDQTMEIKDVNNIVFLTGVIGGRTCKFCLDTGAEINAISSSLPTKVLSTISITRRSSLSGASSSSREVLYGVMNDFKFAGKDLKGMETVIANLSSLQEAYAEQFSGVLGYDFLSKGVISINLRKKQLGICYLKSDEI